MVLPRLYAIVDAEVLAARETPLQAFAEELREGGVRLVQYRNKVGSAQDMLGDAAVLSEVFADSDRTLFFNDRADLAVLAGWDGVHVGQEDLSPDEAKRVMGPNGLVGVSTHTEPQVRLADRSCADYVAVGPVFATGTKADAASVIGLDGVRRARSLTHKPLVAIGGITLANARSVIQAGADSVAVISGLMVEGRKVAEVARDFLAVLG